MGPEASMFCWSKNVRLKAQHGKVETQELWNLSRERERLQGRAGVSGGKRNRHSFYSGVLVLG